MQNEMLSRYIVIKAILNTKVFPGTNGSNVKIIRASSDNESLTVSANINKISGWQGSDATVIINGMLMQDINALIKVNSYITDVQQPVSKIEIYAGRTIDSAGLPPLVYKGDIYSCSVDLNNPNRSRPIIIKSILGWEASGVLANALTINSGTSLKTVFQTLANNLPGTTAIISGADNQQVNDIVYQGTAIQQLQQACNDYGYQLKIDDDKVLISPIGEPMVKQILSVSKDDILLGYPIPQDLSCSIRVRFNPVIQFGQKINVITDMEGYGGEWWVNGMSHYLTNRGKDFNSVLQLNRFNIQSGA